MCSTVTNFLNNETNSAVTFCLRPIIYLSSAIKPLQNVVKTNNLLWSSIIMQQQNLIKTISLYLMAALYVAAGVNHFVHAAMYISIIPSWLPYKLLLSNISGAFEILFGVLLLPKTSRRFAAWGIIFLLIAVYPANIQMSINYYRSNNNNFWLSIIRLPLQFLLLWWAWIYTRKTNNL